jgi:hypothetical protein
VALPSGTTYAEGPNYRIELANRTVVCCIWKRPDLTNEQGANCAEEMADLFQRLAGLPDSMVRGCIMDFREAPHSWGPVTDLALGRAAMAFEHMGRPLAILIGHADGQRLMALEIARVRAPNYGAVFTDEYSCERWVHLDE